MKKTYYALEIVDPDTAREVKNAYLVVTDSTLLLFENLTNQGESIEFSGVMRVNPDKLYDEFEDVYYEDDNIIELTNIRKKKHD